MEASFRYWDHPCGLIRTAVRWSIPFSPKQEGKWKCHLQLKNRWNGIKVFQSTTLSNVTGATDCTLIATKQHGKISVCVSTVDHSLNTQAVSRSDHNKQFRKVSCWYLWSQIPAYLLLLSSVQSRLHINSLLLVISRTRTPTSSFVIFKGHLFPWMLVSRSTPASPALSLLCLTIGCCLHGVYMLQPL